LNDEHAIIERAMSIPGASFPAELGWLYQLAMQAPAGMWFVELGTYCGRSLGVIAAAAAHRRGHVLSIDNYDPFDCQPRGRTPKVVRTHLEEVGLWDKHITLLQGDSRERPPDIDEVGMLFVDSEHTQIHFDAEMRAWLPYVVPAGIVACHDYNSPRWLEMTVAIQHWLFTSAFEHLGCERRTIAFRRTAHD